MDPRRVHSHNVVVLSTGILMWAYAFLAYITISSPIPGIVGFVCSAVHLLSPLLFRITSNAFLISNITLLAGMVHQGTFSYFTGGFTSFILIWYGILPMIAGIVAGKRGTVTWAITTTVVASIFLGLHLSGYQYPDLISPQGRLIAQALIVFGWIFLSSSIIYVLLILNEAREKKLNEQNQKIEDLFRVLFHDLANPLGRISIGLNISKRERSSEASNRGVEIASQAADTMLEITQNVRKMYAVSKGKVNVDLVHVPLNESIDYIRQVYGPELEKKKLTLNYDFIKYCGLKVYVEPVSFKNQVLGNVLSNAIKFSPYNSVIQIIAYPFNHQYFCVEIMDQGIGIPDTILESLFDISKKTSRVGTAGEMGTGFGMHIMKSFVEMYQGKVLVSNIIHNQECKGTSVKILLKGEWI